MRGGLLAALAVLAVGCRSYSESLKRLQVERRIQLDVVQSFRPPTVDAATLAREQPFAGTAGAGRVKASYPLGLERLAGELASQIDGMYGFVEQHTGIPLSFDVAVFLVRVDEDPAASVGDRLQVVGGKCSVCLFVPVDDETVAGVVRCNRLFPYSFVHEMTELSLICPAEGRSPLLVDAVMDDKQIIHGTRWLREGLACYTAEIVTRDYCHADRGELMHRRPYAALHDAGHLLTQWSAFSNRFMEDRYEKTYYSAALGMVLEIIRRKGEDGLRQMVDDLAKEDLADGAAITRLMKQRVGLSPTELAASVEVPLLGIDPRDLTTARARGLGVEAAEGVIVLRTRPFSPAREAGLLPNDVILECNGQLVADASELERRLVGAGAGAPVQLGIWRAGQRQQITAKPVPRPRLEFTEEGWL